MLIRSQDKKSLINMDNVTDLSVVRGSEIMAYYTTDQDYQRIGKYSDESKAIKVLDRIYDAYAMANINFNIVFQMPQESEV